MDDLEHRNSLPKGFQLNEYRIESILGKPGGFGITYLATDTNLDQYVAIKEYLPSDFAIREGVSTVYVKSSSDAESFHWGLKCFTDEARVLARFSHPNIVSVLRFFQENNTAYMVMEYQEGECLTERLKRGIIPEEELLSIVLPLLDGLEQIHAAGFLHRDIKPNNIYIREDNTPVLLDFGSARYAIGQISRSVTSIVSPGYAPLEQYDNEAEEQGPWTDIYALGAVMYFAVSGEAPPPATRRVMKDPMQPAASIGKGRYRRSLLSAIDWALELNEDRRPRTVEQWRDRLMAEPPLSVEVPEHLKVVGITRPSLWARSLCSFAAVGSLILLLLLAGLGIAFVNQNQEMQKHEQALKAAQQQLVEEQHTYGQYAINLEEALAKEEKRLKDMQKLIDKLKHFEPEVVKELTKNHTIRENISLPLYVDIINIRDDDKDGGLVVREFPGSTNKRLGVIPKDTHCVKYTRKSRLQDNSWWSYLEYNDTIKGWVNSGYIRLDVDNLCEKVTAHRTQETEQ
ncbi:serine/threonine protein kinase [Candidatus Albibeggiatoa sp. nov. NOAA]|uniref:serine/threonine protein kinase n=1 Tax=Candidatus Albibeggiatoa sp. nov. NOAA TaxID=3162724 RepID=UPI0032FB0A90|nr:serine/threonine protein kinase [Thiotrichaceae bacterium]